MSLPQDAGLGLPWKSGNELLSGVPFGANARPGVALALGGGLSRGFAHLGVLEVFEKEKIPVVAIAGISIGSLLGAAYADGLPVDELCRLGRQMHIRDLLRSRHARFGGPGKDCISQFVRERLRARTIEDLPIPMAIVASDAETAAPYIFTRGPLDVALRASCAFPGLLPPVEYEGRRLADGCLVAPVPTEAAARMNASCVVGVDTTMSQGGAASSNLAHKSLPPQISPSWATCADLILQPEVQQIAWGDFACVDQARNAGAEAARRVVPELRAWLARRIPPESTAASINRPESDQVSL